MPLTPIETIAAVFAVLGVVKLVVLLINKRAWIKNVAVPLYGNPAGASVVFVILAIFLFYYILQELSIVQIFAVMALTGILMGLGFLLYSNEMIAFARKIYKKKFSGWLWLYIIIWLLLSIWVLYEIFLV